MAVRAVITTGGIIVSYIHHARIVDVNPESELSLMG